MTDDEFYAELLAYLRAKAKKRGITEHEEWARLVGDALLNGEPAMLAKRVGFELTDAYWRRHR